MWLVERNYPERYERFGMTFDVYTPSKQFQIQDEVSFRTYTFEQIEELIAKVSDLELVACYDFRYELDCQIQLDETIEDVVVILQRVNNE